jgi:NAD(P)-dependent dehydrogenase (short-subunit alcohol dehydrogenase family)
LSAIKLQFVPFEDPAARPLADRIVLVTGASKGLGRAIALAAAAAGATTLLLARDVRALERLADEIEAAGGASPSLVPMNLEAATIEHYAEVARLIAERWGRLDGLVLNAGVLGELSPLRNYDPLVWARVFQVNVHANFLLVQACLPLLEMAPSASVIFTSSSVGREARAYWGAYAASKFALEGMMQTLADELAGGTRIRVNSVNPGRCRTRMRAQAYPAENADTLPDPATLAPAFVHLLSDAAEGCHGQQYDLQ